VESSCEFGIEPSGSMKCWESIEWPNKHLVASRVVLSSIKLVGSSNWFHNFKSYRCVEIRT
jgi:hypothetical protein